MKSFLQLYIVFLFLTSQLLFSQKYGYNEKIQVNQESRGLQTNSQVIYLDEEKFLIYWKSEGDSFENSLLKAQIFDNKGKKMGSTLAISNEMYLHSPHVIKLDENVLVVFFRSITTDRRTAIFYNYFNIKTNEISETIQVTDFPNNFLLDFRYLKLSSDKIVICWTDLGRDGYNGGVYAQILDVAQDTISPSFLVNTHTYEYQERACIERLNDTRFVICWDSFEQDGSMHGVYAQIFDEYGVKIGDEILVNTYTESIQWEAEVLKLSDEKFVVFWESSGQDGSGKGIYGQIFNIDGLKIGKEFRANTYTNQTQRNIKLSLLSDDDFIVLWDSDGVDGSNTGVSAQIYDINGSRKGHEILINNIKDGLQALQVIVIVDDKKFIICYLSESLNLQSYSIVMQMFYNDGEKFGSEILIDQFSGPLINNHYFWDQINFSGSRLGEKKFVLVWNNSDFDSEIYADVFLTDPISHLFREYNLIAPKNDNTLETAKPNFAWQYPSNQHINFQWEIEYDLYISENENFQNPRIISGITDTTYQIDTLAAGQTYFWKVLAKNYYGDSLWSSNVNGFFIDHGSTDIEETDETLPTEFALEQNYPNPFNPSTKIKYTIPRHAGHANVGDANFSSQKNVQLEVFNTLGQKIKTLVNEPQQVGTYEVNFQANNLPSGVFYYRLQYGKFSETKKMLLLR